MKIQKIKKTMPQKNLWQIGKILQKLTIVQSTKKIILNKIIINVLAEEKAMM